MPDDEIKSDDTPKQTGAKITPSLYNRLRAQALIEGRTIGGLIDDAIKAYFALIEGDTTRTKPPRPKRGGG